MSCRTLLRLAALLSLLTPSPTLAQTISQVPAAHAAGYHWRTLVLQHARPSDVLALMHWNGPDLTPHPPGLPEGVRRIFALQSNNSLLVDPTEEGFATVKNLVRTLDSAPRRVEFHMSLVAVPEARADLYTPNMSAARLLPLLLAGESRVTDVPAATVTDGQTTLVFIVSPPSGRLRLVQAGPIPDGGPSARRELRLTPHINADGTLMLGLTFGGLPVSSVRTLRSGEMAVYDVTGPPEPRGERLFFFLRPTLLGDSSDADGGSSVTVTP